MHAWRAVNPMPHANQARVEENRQAKEAGFWGRQSAIKRDVPAYWSMATYGQPFHDVRLALGGATNVYQVSVPSARGEGL